MYVVIEGSTGGLNELTPADRLVFFQAEVELASLNPGSVNYDAGVYINAPDDIVYWTMEMQRRNIKPGVAIFEPGMIANTVALVKKGWIDHPLLFTFVLGQIGALPFTPKNLLYLSELVPAESFWAVAGHGGHDLQTSALPNWNHLEPPTEQVGKFAEMLSFPQRHKLDELPRQTVENIQDGFFAFSD